MSEETNRKKLNTAKKAVASILSKAGYKIELTSNNIYCLDAYRHSEHRIIAVGIKEILKTIKFKEQIKRLEKLPNPAPNVITKEIWIRGDEEHGFRQYYFKQEYWENEDFDKVNIFEN